MRDSQKTEEEPPQEVDDGSAYANSQPVWRRMYIRITDLERHGFTDGCEACRLIQNNLCRTGVNHTEECRYRLVQAMRSTPEGRARLQESDKREELHLARAVDISNVSASKRHASGI